MQPLINELLAKNYSVQLRHVPRETSWDDMKDHGYICLFDASGSLLVRRDGFQHNRKLRNGGAWDGKAIADLVEEMASQLTPKLPPSFTESDICTKIEYEQWLAREWPASVASKSFDGAAAA